MPVGDAQRADRFGELRRRRQHEGHGIVAVANLANVEQHRARNMPRAKRLRHIARRIIGPIDDPQMRIPQPRLQPGGGDERGFVEGIAGGGHGRVLEVCGLTSPVMRLDMAHSIAFVRQVEWLTVRQKK